MAWTIWTANFRTLSEGWVAFIMCVLLALASSCSRDGNAVLNQFRITDVKKTVSSAKKVIPVALQMEEMYGDANHFLSSHEKSFTDGTWTWNTEVYFGGRYCLTMQVDVEIDYEKNRVVKMLSEPKFSLGEIIKVTVLSNGLERASSGEGKFFSLSEWEQFYESGGDFLAIGMQKNPNKVPNFDRFATGVRKNHVHVSLLHDGEEKGPEIAD
ncbi:MAG: hypothetical protein GXP28_00815 [Planctomycetes bacterium]|nr:hypothetical protein [Planctomycetota bacterium]